RAGDPGPRLRHEGAAQVVGAAVQHGDGTLVAELDPGALDVGDAAVQQDARHRVDRPVLPPGGARTGDAGQVDRRVLVHERQRHELGEAAGAVLHPGQYPEVTEPVPG